MRVGSIKKTKDTVTSSSFLNTSKEGSNDSKNDNNRAYFNFINSIRSPLSRRTYDLL